MVEGRWRGELLEMGREMRWFPIALTIPFPIAVHDRRAGRGARVRRVDVHRAARRIVVVARVARAGAATTALARLEGRVRVLLMKGDGLHRTTDGRRGRNVPGAERWVLSLHVDDLQLSVSTEHSLGRSCGGAQRGRRYWLGVDIGSVGVAVGMCTVAIPVGTRIGRRRIEFFGESGCYSRVSTTKLSVVEERRKNASAHELFGLGFLDWPGDVAPPTSCAVAAST